MPAVTRTLKITYGATFYVGGDSAYLIHGPVRFEKSYTAFVASFQVVVQNDTASTFKTNCDTVEAAFRTPRQKLKIEMESQAPLLMPCWIRTCACSRLLTAIWMI